MRMFVIERDIPEVGTFERDQLRGAAEKSARARSGAAVGGLSSSEVSGCGGVCGGVRGSSR